MVLNFFLPAVDSSIMMRRYTIKTTSDSGATLDCACRKLLNPALCSTDADLGPGHVNWLITVYYWELLL